MEYIYITKKGNTYPIDVYLKSITTQAIVYDPVRIEQYCRTGCKNYGRTGGCPPFAPKLEHILQGIDVCVLIVGLFDSKHKPEKVRMCANRAIHWKFQDAVLANCMDQIGRKLKTQFGWSYLGTGYCMGCHGKKCSLKEGHTCRYPDKRTFSMEATGIDVVQTVQNVFYRRFHWYTKSNTNIPYLMKCILLYSSKDKIDQATIEQYLLHGL